MPQPEGYAKALKALRRGALKGQAGLIKACKKVPMHVWECLVLHDAKTWNAIKQSAQDADTPEPVL
jgi:hypothetical protein